MKLLASSATMPISTKLLPAVHLAPSFTLVRSAYLLSASFVYQRIVEPFKKAPKESVEQIFNGHTTVLVDAVPAAKNKNLLAWRCLWRSRHKRGFERAHEVCRPRRRTEGDGHVLHKVLRPYGLYHCCRLTFAFLQCNVCHFKQQVQCYSSKSLLGK